MDKYPVTNAEYKKFMDETNYQPEDKKNFLKHWPNGKIPKGEENYPVVYVSYEDAKAYCLWAKKRLPTELEWQYAAQTEDGREWPWSKNTKNIYREEEPITETLTVFKIKGIDSIYCNLGNGKMDPVGKYPKGANPNGLEDLVGSVWQLTNDIYQTGSYDYIIIKGGSYYNPASSWWYVQGGPRELHYREHLLRVSEGFERNATIGFRCVKDL
jgi:formylglycine-generating enzyme required for sulfatase activity